MGTGTHNSLYKFFLQNNQHTVNTLTNTISKLINNALTALHNHFTQPTNQSIEYDDALLDEFSIPDHLSYSQFLKRSQHRTLNLLHSIPLNPTQQQHEQHSIDIDVPTAAHQQENHPSFLPNPALLENYFKPCPSGSKSSRRQSAILRNLVSAALGKLISHVTNNQQMHWPGSDTEERLAAIGLQIELLAGSKLTTDVIHKGPKNLQLQQCKRILLELELGLIRLKQIKPVPRPLRGSKKKFKPLHSPNPTESYHPEVISSPTTPPDILANPAGLSTSSASASSSCLKAADDHPLTDVLGKNFENCDPALLALGPSYLSPVDQQPLSIPGPPSSKTAALPADDSTNHRELVHRYITSNRHPNTPFIDPPPSSSAASSSSSSSSSSILHPIPPLPSSSRLSPQNLLSHSINPLLNQVDDHSHRLINHDDGFHRGLDQHDHHHDQNDGGNDSLDDADKPRQAPHHDYPSSTKETRD
ncbi:hypothetical protein VP01_2193g1 [Puccinia sorghi]|uniref:Uncharacterized protein n=1 Tax=Puccinia sorghi TaxID=27349 RepID=A0A0L6V954_9BASI|nr:hypothetical protein VP01_2193g1 [Puccinia sorghi]